MANYKLNQRFLDPEKVLFRAGLAANQTVADFGAGSGFYALAAGKVVGNGGKVFVVDIVESALTHVSAEARLLMLRNIQTIRADLEQPGSAKKIADGSCDLVVYGNVLHQIKDQKNLFAETYRVLKTGGKLLVVDWNDRPGPIGPKSDARMSEADAKKSVSAAGFRFDSEIDTDNYHYGLIFVK